MFFGLRVIDVSGCTLFLKICLLLDYLFTHVSGWNLSTEIISSLVKTFVERYLCSWKFSRSEMLKEHIDERSRQRYSGKLSDYSRIFQTKFVGGTDDCNILKPKEKRCSGGDVGQKEGFEDQVWCLELKFELRC